MRQLASRPQRLGLKTHARVFGLLLLSQTVFQWVGYQQLGRWIFGTHLWLQNSLLMRSIHLVWFIIISTPILYTIVIALISRERRYGMQLWQLAHQDLLTGIANRRMFIDELNKSLGGNPRSNHSVAVLMIDLDGFKSVNDTYGHDMGDHVLITIARRFESVIGSTGIVSRLGGDEFAVLVPEVSDYSALGALCSQLLYQAEVPIKLSPETAPDAAVSASIGVALYPEQAADVNSLLRAADNAMYQAKRSGRK